MTRLSRLLVATTLVALALDVRNVGAQEHAHHGTGNEAIGTVHFPTTCAPAVAPRMEAALRRREEEIGRQSFPLLVGLLVVEVDEGGRRKRGRP
jgi:hypothetical protein